MQKLAAFVICCALTACTATRPTLAPQPWERRSAELQHADTWQLSGRAAVAVGTQGWQASLDWHQHGPDTDLRLSGPFGVGALELKKTAEGLSLNGAPPNDAVVAQLEDRLGFELPLEPLRYWLLGVPDPGAPFELTRNDQDRAQQLIQAAWTVAYERYVPVKQDWLPARLVLTREGVRVRIVVDHWEAP